MKLKELLKLLGFILICEIIGSIGSIATIPNIPTWYALLAKPFFAPPLIGYLLLFGHYFLR